LANRREALSIAAGIMALLPMSFVAVVERGGPADRLFGDGSIQWIMWRDAPIWAAACAAVAIVLGLLWVLSRPAPSDNGGVP
jgi:membrane-associated PAP2 superfamily phosphatase